MNINDAKGPDMLEEILTKRVDALEYTSREVKLLIQHLTDSVDEIKESIKAALDVKGKVVKSVGNPLRKNGSGLPARITHLNTKQLQQIRSGLAQLPSSLGIFPSGQTGQHGTEISTDTPG